MSKKTEANPQGHKLHEIVVLNSGKFSVWGGISYIGSFDTQEEAEILAEIYKSKNLKLVSAVNQGRIRIVAGKHMGRPA